MRKSEMTDIDFKIQRGNCFKLLAACFYEPDKELFVQEKLCANLASLLSSSGYEDASLAAIAMKAALEASDAKEMQVEYARLFVGPFDLVAPPYGSVYLENKRMLMGDSTVAVQKMYQDAGLKLDIKEAPDHIAIELEFLHFLCLREAQAHMQEEMDQARFFSGIMAEFQRRCFAPWVGKFCDNIRKGTENSFYIALADCLEPFVKQMISGDEVAEYIDQQEAIHDCRAAV